MTPRQKKCLEFIRDYTAKKGGVSPSHREICDHLDLKSPSGVNRLIVALDDSGLISRVPMRARSLYVTKKGLSILDQAVVS